MTFFLGGVLVGAFGMLILVIALACTSGDDGGW